MAFFAPSVMEKGMPVAALIVYWGVFLLLLLLSLYAALLDLQYIRLQYLVGRREIFQETLGSEEFRSALREAHQPATEKEKK